MKKSFIFGSIGFLMGATSIGILRIFEENALSLWWFPFMWFVGSFVSCIVTENEDKMHNIVKEL